MRGMVELAPLSQDARSSTQEDAPNKVVSVAVLISGTIACSCAAIFVGHICSDHWE